MDRVIHLWGIPATDRYIPVNKPLCGAPPFQTHVCWSPHTWRPTWEECVDLGHCPGCEQKICLKCAVLDWQYRHRRWFWWVRLIYG